MEGERASSKTASVLAVTPLQQNATHVQQLQQLQQHGGEEPLPLQQLQQLQQHGGEVTHVQQLQQLQQLQQHGGEESSDALGCSQIPRQGDLVNFARWLLNLNPKS